MYAGLDLRPGRPSLVHDLDDYVAGYCYVCRFHKIIYFNLRGICDELYTKASHFLRYEFSK